MLLQHMIHINITNGDCQYFVRFVILIFYNIYKRNKKQNHEKKTIRFSENANNTIEIIVDLIHKSKNIVSFHVENQFTVYRYFFKLLIGINTYLLETLN